MQLEIRTRAAAIAVAALCLAAACEPSHNPGIALAGAQELRVRLSSEPSTFDPGQQYWNYESAVGRLTFEALLRPTKDFKEVAGGAADSYQIDGTGTVYTFGLHPGAKWSDGQPVKAQDFVYGFQRLLDPRLAAPYSSFYTQIKNGATVSNMDPKNPGVDAALQTLGLKAVDDHTFQVTLDAPAGYFKWIATLFTSAPVRKDIVQKYGKDSSGTDRWGAVGATAPQQVVGNGPYKISEFVDKDHVTLVPNPSYSGSQPKTTLTKVTEYFIDDEAAAYQKYKAAELDMVGVPLGNTDAVRSSPELMQVPQLSVYWINMNVKKAPFDNPKVRLAFAQAIDRDSYNTDIRKGRSISSTTLIPKGMRAYRPDLGAPQKFDPTTARATLASAGVSAASLKGVKYLYQNTSLGKLTAEFIQTQLKANLGVDIVPDPNDERTVGGRLRTGDYQFGGPSGWGADYADSQDFFDIFMTGSGNQFSFWSSKPYDDAVAAADAASDQAKRDSGYETAAKVLVSEAPVIFFYQPTSWLLVKPYVKGIITTPNDDQWFGSYFTWSIQIAKH